MVVFTHVASVLFYLVKGLKIKASHPSKSGQNGDLTGYTYTLLLEQTLKFSIVNLRLSLVKF